MTAKKVDRLIPFRVVERIIKKANPKCRISDDSKVALGKSLEDIGLEIAGIAWDLAQHGKRVTIKEVDIKMAVKSWFNQKKNPSILLHKERVKRQGTPSSDTDDILEGYMDSLEDD
jgi:histone H3/H4